MIDPDFCIQTVHCPENMKDSVLKVLNGEYDLHNIEFSEPPVVLDIGSCVGDFAAWYSWRYPGAKITCYEPHPVNFEYLQKNRPNDTLVNAAVHDHDGEMFLFNGQFNDGSATLYKHLAGTETNGYTVKVMNSSHLPPAEVLKLDTEGSELPIVSHYSHWDGVNVVLLEWHSLSDRYRIGAFLLDKGFHILSDSAWHPHFGIMKAVRVPEGTDPGCTLVRS